MNTSIKKLDDGRQTESMTSLFLSQSYQDAWEDYARSLKKEGFARWDYIVLTASNEEQAEGFHAQIALWQKEKLLPSQTRFLILPDPDGKRVGSGGATLNVLRAIAEAEGTGDFTGKKILVIHSGGDSKRVPQYSAMGKLFSPVPHELPDGRTSTLFDEFMAEMSGVAGRIREGMVLLSGDVLLLFNSLQIDFPGRGAAAVSFKENVEIGKNHGVFLMGEDGNVAKFLHKQTTESLRAQGAVNEQDSVDIDTGMVIFSPEILNGLYSLISRQGIFDKEKYDTYVNETVRLSLYGDFLYPLAGESTLEAFYEEKPEGEFCPELLAARKVVWEILRPYRMKLLRLSPAKFLHFGTTAEILKLMTQGTLHYSHLGWKSKINSSVGQNPSYDRDGTNLISRNIWKSGRPELAQASARPGSVAALNSILSTNAECGEDCYLEVSYVHPGSVVGNHVVLSYIDIHGETIPDEVVLHGLKQRDGRFVVRIYGIHDNPKTALSENGCAFLTGTLRQFMDRNGISENELWDEGENKTLWTARLYPVCSTIPEAVAAALNIYEMVNGNGDATAWKNSERKSLCSGFGEASPHALIDWQSRMHELVKMDSLEQIIHTGGTVQEVRNLLQKDSLSKIQNEWLDRHIGRGGFSSMIRLYYYIGCALGGPEGEKYIDKCFQTIGEEILAGTLDSIQTNSDCRIQCEEHHVNLPLRVNWGGGWSDTPPYCNENGGTVLNAAISLNGDLPVKVTLRRLEEHKIVFDSRDMDTHGEFTEIESLQSCGDPYDSFALQKAALLVCGIIPAEGSSLEEVLERIGGGIFMSTEVVGVPKGSGLGTSSILAGACVKALFEFTGITYTQEDLYDHVLCMEQLMSTGGGWQDQVGGLSMGLKYITAESGMHQYPKVQQIELKQETKDELNSRFALIYTGQRRLARNLLRDVVGRYIGNEPDALYALSEIQRTAALMRFELERGNVDAFAKLLSEHWELSKKLDKGSTNTCIDQIFAVIEDLIDGKMICGAGGGGFLQVILKKNATKEMLEERLNNVFQDSGVNVWESEILW